MCEGARNNGRFERIDFADLESSDDDEGGDVPSVAKKLSDDDVFAMLSCIKLTGHDIKRFGLGDLILWNLCADLKHWSSLV